MTVRRFVLPVEVAAVIALIVALIWGLGRAGDRFDPRCMQPTDTPCPR